MSTYLAKYKNIRAFTSAYKWVNATLYVYRMAISFINLNYMAGSIPMLL